MEFDGNIIRVLRTWKGFSQRELARRTGVSYSLISYIEKGARNLTPEVESRVRRVLDLDNETIHLVLQFHNEMVIKQKAEVNCKWTTNPSK